MCRICTNHFADVSVMRSGFNYHHIRFWNIMTNNFGIWPTHFMEYYKHKFVIFLTQFCNIWKISWWQEHSWNILNMILQYEKHIFEIWPRGREVRAVIPCSSGAGRQGSIPAISDAQNVPAFRRWRFEMKLSLFFCCNLVSALQALHTLSFQHTFLSSDPIFTFEIYWLSKLPFFVVIPSSTLKSVALINFKLIVVINSSIAHLQ